MQGYKQTLLILLLSNSLLSGLQDIPDVESFQKQVITEKKPTLAAFTADWCHVCQEIKPQLQKLTKDPAYAHINFIDIDTTRMHKLSQEYGIVAVPTIIYFKNGIPVRTTIGVQSIETFTKDVQSTLHELYPQTRTQIDLGADITPDASLTARIFRGMQHFLAQLTTTFRGLYI